MYTFSNHKSISCNVLSVLSVLLFESIRPGGATLRHGGLRAGPAQGPGGEAPPGYGQSIQGNL